MTHLWLLLLCCNLHCGWGFDCHSWLVWWVGRWSRLFWPSWWIALASIIFVVTLPFVWKLSIFALFFLQLFELLFLFLGSVLSVLAISAKCLSLIFGKYGCPSFLHPDCVLACCLISFDKPAFCHFLDLVRWLLQFFNFWLLICDYMLQLNWICRDCEFHYRDKIIVFLIVICLSKQGLKL